MINCIVVTGSRALSLGKGLTVAACYNNDPKIMASCQYSQVFVANNICEEYYQKFATPIQKRRN